MQPATIHTTGARTAALRPARACYDHLAGVSILDGLVKQRALVESQSADRLTTPVSTEPYVLGPAAASVFGRLGVDLDALLTRPRSVRPLLRFCIDWTEQRYHLAGALGAAVLARAEAARWVVRHPGSRAVDVTDAGRRAFHDTLGIPAIAA